MLNKKLVSLAFAAACGMGAVTAQAGVLGQAVLDVTNFQFLNPDGTTINSGQFNLLIFQDSSQALANLNNVVATQTINQATFGTLDLPQQCVGACGGFGQNDFSHRSAPSTVNVARADTLLTGAPIINPAGIPTPAHASVVTEGQLTTIGGFGNVQANIGLTASFRFALSASQAVQISLDSISHLIAAVGVGDFGTSRSAEGWTIDVRDVTGALVFSWSPNGGAGGIVGGTEIADDCDLPRAVNAQIPGQTSTYDCSGHAQAITGVLAANTIYTVGLRHSASTDVTRVVPEPNALLLLGVALAGLGFVTRRKQS